MLPRARLLARARAPISVRLATPTPGVRIRLPGPLSAPTSRLASTSPSVRASVAAQLGTHVSFSPLPPSTTPTPSALSSSPDSSSSSSSSTATTTIAEADSAPRKLPRKLATYTPALARLSARTGVPLPSLLASFLVLHELTALVPLVVLFYLFSALGAGSAFLHWLHSIAKTATGEEVEEGPFASAAHVVRGWYDEGARRVERVGRRYGLFGFEKGSKADGDGTVGREAAGAVADAVAAYVVVKVSRIFGGGLGGRRG